MVDTGVKRVTLLEKGALAFKIAPAVGTCLAELIVEGRARTVDITAFRPERFAEGRRIEGRHPYAPRRDHVEPTR
jgi:glycine/D-amino acid oxidase-like deaminating enzyme